MSGQAVFEQLVASMGQDPQTRALLRKDDYEQWRHDYIWEALHGMRYGQSFCNRFGIKDNNLYYAPGDIDWCDQYIRKNYLA